MNYQLIKDVIDLIEKFDTIVDSKIYSNNIEGFKHWIYDIEKENHQEVKEPYWEGKEKGRSPESVINTLVVHMNKFAKTYSKSAIHNSDFSTQEDFIYLINLKAFGEMTKTDLIKKNIQEKPVGMQIINRLIKQGWVQQLDSLTDKRSKIISITEQGSLALDQNMQKIRQATEIVTGNLTQAEKMQLIVLLQKLEDFHHIIYAKNTETSALLDVAYQQYLDSNN